MTWEREVYKPIHEKAIEKGILTNWSVWSVFPNPRNEYQYVTVNAVSDLNKYYDMNYQEMFNAVFPDRDFSEVNERTNELRTVVSSHIFRVVDLVMPRP